MAGMQKDFRASYFSKGNRSMLFSIVASPA